MLQRSLHEYAALLDRAGFAFDREIVTRAGVAILESVADVINVAQSTFYLGHKTRFSRRLRWANVVGYSDNASNNGSENCFPS